MSVESIPEAHPWFMASLVNIEYGNMGCKVSKGGIQKQVNLNPKLSGPQLRHVRSQVASWDVR